MTLQTRIKECLIAALLAAGCTASVPALAQDTGWYLGGAIGQSQFDLDTGPLTAIGATGLTTDDSDTGFKIYGGYQFNKTWAVEFGYIDFGSVGVRGTFLGTPFTGNVDVTAFTVAAVGTIPINNNFSLFGKAGLYTWEGDATVTVAGAAGAASGDGTDPMVGIGVRYNLNRNLGVQAEFEYFAGDDTINFLSIGLRYKF